jgi:hypothetical protein
MATALSVEQLLDLPAAVDIETAGRAYGRGRTWSQEAARTGTFPVPVRRVGHRWIVRRCDLLADLGLDGSGADPPEMRRGNTLNGAATLTGTNLKRGSPDEHRTAAQ